MGLFDPERIRPGYTLRDIESLLFLRKDLSDLSEDDERGLLGKANGIGLTDLRLDAVQLLLCVMHEARETDAPLYFKKIFLPWHEIRRKTQIHRERIGSELGRAPEFEPDSEQDVAHFVNIYRSIVADLFDPYLTLFVASFQLKEGKFTTLRDADLGQGERTKYDYLASRIGRLYKGKESLLSGYDPRVRNAISHAGSRGVTYQPGRVVFKNIKRGNPPTAETVIWTFEELQLRVMQLLECISSIGIATEIFSLDCMNDIIADAEGVASVLWHAGTPEQRAETRARVRKLRERVLADNETDYNEKLEFLGQFLFHQYGLRDMPSNSVGFSKEKNAVLVEIPADIMDTSDDTQVRRRALKICQYAIIAREIFGNLYEGVCIAEKRETGERQIFASFKGHELDEYSEERAGLYDLVNDAQWSMEGTRIGMQIDFDALEVYESMIPDDPFPRKQRPST